MPQIVSRELLLFAKFTGIDRWWVEQILGSVIQPLQKEFGSELDWMWATRYIQPISDVKSEVTEYMKDHPISTEYLAGNRCFYLVFRFGISRYKQIEFEGTAIELASKAGYYVPPIMNFDYTNDLGGHHNRFTKSDATLEEREQRAYLILKFMDATLKLMLHSLQQENNHWRLENNENPMNFENSFLYSIHHLFCNCTDAPTPIWLYKETTEEKTSIFISASPYLTVPVDVDEIPLNEAIPVPTRF